MTVSSLCQERQFLCQNRPQFHKMGSHRIIWSNNELVSVYHRYRIFPSNGLGTCYEVCIHKRRKYYCEYRLAICELLCSILHRQDYKTIMKSYNAVISKANIVQWALGIMLFSITLHWISYNNTMMITTYVRPWIYKKYPSFTCERKIWYGVSPARHMNLRLTHWSMGDLNKILEN